MFIPELQLAAAFLLDLVLGDPRKFPHPVKGIGLLAMKTEALLRGIRWLPLHLAGIATVIIVVGATTVAAWSVLWLCALVNPVLENVMAAVMLYFTFAAKDLAKHARAVMNALQYGGLSMARKNVGMIVGRDADAMQEEDVAQAAVESVAENTVDGVTAPLFFALLFGPVGAMAYKAVNTLDSCFGYKNERHLEFGWASARLDDLVNYLPARLTVPAVALAAAMMRLRFADVFRSVAKTARLHASPNAGYPEAAFAGALGVRLGGLRSYGAVMHSFPHLGVVDTLCSAHTIRQAFALMFAASAIFLASGLGIRILFKLIMV